MFRMDPFTSGKPEFLEFWLDVGEEFQCVNPSGWRKILHLYYDEASHSRCYQRRHASVPMSCSQYGLFRQPRLETCWIFYLCREPGQAFSLYLQRILRQTFWTVLEPFHAPSSTLFLYTGSTQNHTKWYFVILNRTRPPCATKLGVQLLWDIIHDL
jgi:hypothetical protein